jgi:aromatic-L-amino-acid decarboxylase
MDSTEFRKCGKQMIDIAADYLDNIETRKVLPDIKPGYLRELIPDSAPEDPEKWDDLVTDIERVIMPGVTHWHSPNFHAYYPSGNSYPAICADILSNAIGCIGFSWIASPACTELEVVMLDWLAKMLKLPDFYLASTGGEGGGVLQGTASEATYVALLAAKNKRVKEIEEANPQLEKHFIHSRLVAYCSEQVFLLKF